MKRLRFADQRTFCRDLNEFRDSFGSLFTPEEFSMLRKMLTESEDENADAYDAHGLPKALLTLRAVKLFSEQVEPDREMMLAMVLYPLLHDGLIDILSVRKQWGEEIASMLVSLADISSFSHKGPSAGYDNLREMLVALADDIRVLIIMIVNNLALMREINLHPDQKWVRNVAFEASYIYSQLAHRLGLYKIKGELEDLALKYTNREIYKSIAKKLNETKRSRDAYITAFIEPVRKKLEEAGLKFEIKGRTKSISSIWDKMRKQKTDVNGIYDLFAIRVIIDSPGPQGKDDCWNVYSIVGNMYQTDEKRMRDWLSFPKSNGYESLHATVKGPEDKWVEVQIRTREMDLVAEKGLAAHWSYKGGKRTSNDQWMKNVRDVLETHEEGPMKMLKSLKPDSIEQEVYAFTPKGQLFKLHPGATVLDFAFHIHTGVGCHCTGARINGQHRKINHKIESGDTVEILTSPTQMPRQSWLDMVVTSKAKTKIRQSLNEGILKKAAIGKETFERRARNRKIDIDESLFNRLIRKEGYKLANDFFADIEEGKVDIGKFLSQLQEFQASSTGNDAVKISAGEYRMQAAKEENEDKGNSPLLIDGKKIAGIEYKLSKCCNPVFGDKIFGFFSADGAIKVHKEECPNVRNIRKKYPERIVEINWSGSSGGGYLANIRIIGTDDLGIVNNITSIISKDMGVDMRNIRVDSVDGIFQGYLTVSVKDLSQLSALLKKLATVKGIKSVERI